MTTTTTNERKSMTTIRGPVSAVYQFLPVDLAEEADAFTFRRRDSRGAVTGARLACDECAYDNNRDEFGRPIGECLPVLLSRDANCFLCGGQLGSRHL